MKKYYGIYLGHFTGAVASMFKERMLEKLLSLTSDKPFTKKQRKHQQKLRQIAQYLSIDTAIQESLEMQ